MMARLETTYKNERIEALSVLMDRLCDPDLMLPEAALLRARLAALLREPTDETWPASTASIPAPAPAPVPAPVPVPVARPRVVTPLHRNEKERPATRSPRAVLCLC